MEGDEGAAHEDRAMGEVQDPVDAEDEGEAEREERVHATDHEPVEDLLDDHRPSRPQAASLPIGRIVRGAPWHDTRPPPRRPGTLDPELY